MSIPVVTVGDSRDDLVGGLERLHGPVSVVRRCSELAELLAACQSGLARAAVVAEGSEELTASLVDRLSAVGVVVLALTDNPEETVRLRAIGVAAEARAVDAAALAARISAAVAQLVAPERDRGRPAGDSAASVAAAGQVPRSSGAQTVTASPGAKGRIIAVWGPAGSPGRTLVAANIAGELAAEGNSVLLVDADSYGASVAALLGLLDEAAGLAQACRLADQGLLDAEALLRIATPVPPRPARLRVLTGITRADRWTELRAAALTLVLERAREIADVTVVDTGFCLEADEELALTVAPAPKRRDPAKPGTGRHGLCRRGGGLDRGPEAGPRPRRASCGRPAGVPASGPEQGQDSPPLGARPERQLRDAWERYGPAAPLSAFLPCRPGLRATPPSSPGSLLLEAAPESPLRQGDRRSGLCTRPAKSANPLSFLPQRSAGQRARLAMRAATKRP